MFLTWGRLQGEVLGYSYNQSNGLPPTSYLPQKFHSFRNHPSYNYIDSDEVPYLYINSKSMQRSLIEESEIPSFQLLIGSQLIKSPEGFSLFHLAEDGSIVVQGHCINQPSIETECSLNSSLLDIESDVKKFELMKQETNSINLKTNLHEHSEVHFGPALDILLIEENISTERGGFKLEIPDQSEVFGIRTLYLIYLKI